MPLKDIESFMNHFGQHLLVMSWFEGKRDRNGVFFSESFSANVASGTLICRHEQGSQLWGILTAGHVFSDYKERIQTGRIVSDNHRLWDGWLQPSSPAENWTTFNPFDFPHDFLDDSRQGIDVGVVLLAKFHLRSLKQRMVGWSSANLPSTSNSTGHLLLGEPFREESLSDYSSSDPAIRELNYIPSPRLVFVEKQAEPEEYQNVPHRQFFAKVGFADQLPSIAGMSGGPIFEVAESPDGRISSFPVAIQSRWRPQSRLIIATAYADAYQWGIDALQRVYSNLDKAEQGHYLLQTEE
jgi:hypothetical protein